MRKMLNWGKIKFTLLGIFAVAFMFVTFSFVSHAAEGTITAPSAKIRETASTSSAQVGSALNGEKYAIISQETGADGYTWYKISFDGTKSGYVRSDLISVEGAAAVEQKATYNPTVAVVEIAPVSATVTASSVRVRPDAAASGGVVTSVVKDTVLTIDGMATGSDGKNWFRVNCTVSGEAILGFVREDFVSLQGQIDTSQEVQPQEPETPQVPQEGQQPAEPVATPEPKVYDTVLENDKWYLFNNEKNEKYVIEDLFSAVSTNADLAAKYEKTAKTQKGFIWGLVIFLLAAVGVIAFLVWKLKDMMDEAYFKQVEKNTLRDREAAPKKVMHTVGVERSKQGNGQPIRKPVQGQTQKTAQAQRSGQRPAGEGVRKPVNQTKTGGEAVRKPVNRPEGTPSVAKQVQQRSEGEAVKKQVVEKATNVTATQQDQPGQVKQSVVQPQKEQQVKKDNGKPQGWQSKNFMTDDDEFEFEFLNWDGEEEV